MGIQNLNKKAGIKTDIHYHSLIHIFITNCLGKNINPLTVLNQICHTDIKMTILVYAKINNDENKKEDEKINNRFDQAKLILTKIKYIVNLYHPLLI